MITFKQFLVDDAVGADPTYTNMSVAKAVKFLNKHCKNALWMLHENRPIYRGDYFALRQTRDNDFSIVDSTKTERRSANTSNWYTIILDNHPNRQHFPKRSRSLIASTDRYTASSYDDDGEVIILIPTDSAKIGLVNEDDMWSTEINFPKFTGCIEDMNHVLTTLARATFGSNFVPSMEALDKINQALLSNKDSLASWKLREELSQHISDEEFENIRTNFLKLLINAYSEEATGHKAATTATMPHNYDGELWIGGEMIVISEDMWTRLLKAI